MYAASVPAPLARFVGSKQKYERLRNLASKGVTIGDTIEGERERENTDCTQNLQNLSTFIYIYIFLLKCIKTNFLAQ